MPRSAQNCLSVPAVNSPPRSERSFPVEGLTCHEGIEAPWASVAIVTVRPGTIGRRLTLRGRGLAALHAVLPAMTLRVAHEVTHVALVSDVSRRRTPLRRLLLVLLALPALLAWLALLALLALLIGLAAASPTVGAVSTRAPGVWHRRGAERGASIGRLPLLILRDTSPQAIFLLMNPLPQLIDGNGATLADVLREGCPPRLEIIAQPEDEYGPQRLLERLLCCDCTSCRPPIRSKLNAPEEVIDCLVGLLPERLQLMRVRHPRDGVGWHVSVLEQLPRRTGIVRGVDFAAELRADID